MTDIQRGLWTDLLCPHCAEEMHGMLLADPESDAAAFILARDEEHMMQIVNQYADPQIGSDGIDERRSSDG